MSIKSTELMTREELIQHICDKLSLSELWDIFTDEQLEDMAEKIGEQDGNIFTNYRIIPRNFTTNRKED